MTDADLVESARRGDDAAFGELVRRHQRQVLAVALSLLGDRSDAEDLAQETFIRASRNLDLLADPAKFSRWVRRIAFGVCIDWLRSFRPELYRSGDLLDDASALRSGEPSPLERLERLELSRRVLDALATLPPRYRVPLTMFHLEGLSHEKVAKALDVPVGTARSLVTRARKKLAPLLEPYAREVLSMSSAIDEVFDEQPRAPRMLHVLNGDSVRMTLERSSVPGVLGVWADVLHEGPVPGGLSRREFLETRARFLSADDPDTSYESTLAQISAWDARLLSYSEFEEVVLWFEHDLFDQLLLVHHLDLFERANLGTTRLSLICIGEYPGVERFIGLGQLNEDQLASLVDTRQRVTPEQLALGSAAWRAFTAPDPTDLERIASGDTTPLPFLAGAIVRFLEDYPSTENGLGRTERQIATVLASGPRAPSDLFLAMYPLEERPFMGDTTFWMRVQALARAAHPLVTVRVDEERGTWLPLGEVQLTATGRDVLEGRADWVELNGIDRWLGGVRLRGERAEWRWDGSEKRIRRG